MRDEKEPCSKFPWLGSKEGISDEVLPPWTPLRVTVRQGDEARGRRTHLSPEPLITLSVNCWGRSYDFSDGPFPVAVETAGKPVLGAPIRVVARAQGREVQWDGEGPRLQQETPARVALTTDLSGDDLRLSVQTAIEYDGMIRVDWQLEPQRPLLLEELAVEIPLRAEHARYLYHYPGRWGESYNARALMEEGFAASFRPFIWLGDEERGLTWFSESDENWFAADPDRVTEIVREGDTVVLRLRLVSTPIELTPGSADKETLRQTASPSTNPTANRQSQIANLRYTFGLQATPVKPNAEDVWDWRLCHGGDYGIEALPPDAQTTLRYPAEGNILLKQGTVELYVQPLFETGSPEKERGLFALELPRGDEVRWFWPADGQGMRLVVRQGQDKVVELGTRPDWTPGVFHHLAFTWGESVRIYHEGILLAEAPRHGTFVGSTAGGAIVFGSPGNHLLLDEIRISDVARSAQELAQAANANEPPGLDDHVLLLDHLDIALEPGIIEHLDGGHGGYTCTSPARAAGDWGWNRKPGGIVGLGRFRPGKFGNALELGLDKPPLDYLVEAGVRTLCIHEQWTDLEGYTSTTHGEKLHSLVKACHERGIRLLVYLGFLLSDLAPEWPEFGEECIVEPHSVYDPYDYPPQPHQRAFTVCYRSVWQDALAHGIARLMDEYDVDGVYLDGTANPWACQNRHHGCGYVKPDGSIGATYPVFATREMMRRIYTVVKTRKPQGHVNVHQSTCMTIPTLAWATSYWDGEQFGSIEPGPFALEVIPLDAFRTEFMGHQWGVPAEFLCYDRPYTYEQACAFTLPHDVLVRANGLGPHLELESNLWQLSDEFGRKEAEWLPYWRNSEYVSVQPEGVVVSLYRHVENGVLAVVSNLSREVARVKVAFDLSGPGLGDNPIAKDALSGTPIPLSGGHIDLDLTSLGWKLLWLRKP